MNTLRTIHVGVGNRGKWPLSTATPEKGFTPVALVDLNPDALTEAQGKVGPVPTFASIADALRNVEADAAIVCAPTHLHVPLGKQALEAGLHLLVEKGMAPSLAEAQDLVASANETQRKFCVAQNHRYMAGPRTVARLLTESDDPHYLGEVWCIDFTDHRCRPEPKNLTYPHAAIWDMSCHHFDNFLYWLGQGFSRIQGMSYAAPFSAYEHDNNTSFHITHDSGCRIIYTHTHDAGVADSRLILHGERGTMIGDERGIRFTRRGRKNFAPPEWQDVPKAENFDVQGVTDDFGTYIREDIEPGISGSNNLTVMKLCDAAVQACGGQPVEIPT